MARFTGNPLTLGSVRGDHGLVHMSAAERARHLYVVGATRTGKSKLLEDCIRQDVLAWPRSGCGMLVLDRHGSLYDNTMKWAAARDLSSWPIVPIDLRRSDWVVSYNPLRRRGRGEDDSVIVGNFVRSMLHACGQSNLNETPRLLKWLEAMLGVLLTNRLTLVEALQLISSPAVRRSLTANIEDVVARTVWETAPPKEADFQEMVESTVNRVRRFLSRRVIRATLGQTEASLDLGNALEEGQIILACIATEGAKIDEEDASTIGSLLLSDLWMAAKARGKRDEGGVKPFYVYLDEFQEYVTPSMAETLDQASGFGLHMTFAHQFPSQLLKSPQGEQLYNSVLANCRSKITFQIEHNKDLEALALMLYRQQVNILKVKHELYTNKVVGHNVTYMDSYTSGVSEGVGGGTQKSRTTGRSHEVGTSWSHTDGQNESFSETDGTSESESVGYSESVGITAGSSLTGSSNENTTDAESDSESENWSDAEGTSRGRTTSDGTSWSSSRGQTSGNSSGTAKNRSQTLAFGQPNEALQGELEGFWAGDLDDEKDGEFQRKWVQSMAITRGDSETQTGSSGTSSTDSSGGSRASSESEGTSLSRSRGGGTSQGVSRSRGHGRGESRGSNLALSRSETNSVSTQTGTSHSESITRGTSTADTYGGSKSYGRSRSKTTGENTSWSRGKNAATTTSPMLMPVMGSELSSVTFETVEEQLFRFGQYIAGQPDRHCVIKLVSKPALPVITLTVQPGRTTDEWVQDWATFMVQGLGFAFPMEDALLRIDQRQRAMAERLLGEAPAEPATTRIPVDVKVRRVTESTSQA